MKKRLLFILFLLLAASMVILTLAIQSNVLNKHKNGFERTLMPNFVTELRAAAFDNVFTDVCGFNDSIIYLGTTTPGTIGITDTDLGTVRFARLDLSKIRRLAPVFYTHVKYPYIYVLGGNARAIVRGNLASRNYEVSYINTGPFSNAITACDGIYILRAIDTNTFQSQFKRIVPDSGMIKTETDLSEKLSDAGFTYDGHLTYDPLVHRFLFTCFYCNRLICFDDQLNLIYKGYTIDTFRTPKVKIRNTGIAFTHEDAPVTLNNWSCAFGGVLYVWSMLQADNDDPKSFYKNAMIDMYEEGHGVYLGSFTIPFKRGQNLRYFDVINNQELVAIYDSKIILYTIRQPI